MSLAADNRRLAFWIAGRFRAPDADAVRSAALLGLVEAEKAYDPARGRFASLAGVLCRRRAWAEVMRQRRLARVEEHLTFLNRDGEEIERPDLPPTLPADVEAPHMAVRLREALDELPPREAEVLRLRFGLDGEVQTGKAVGLALGLSSSRVGQLERMALRRLRQALTKKPASRRC